MTMAEIFKKIRLPWVMHLFFIRLARYLKAQNGFFKYFIPKEPIDRMFGYGRGTPLDRYFIERFIENHKKDVTGHCLEVGDPRYIKEYGKDVSKCDVLHLTGSHADDTTIVGDLQEYEILPQNQFDCFICTQTLQYCYDYKKAVQGIHSTLKSGGVALVTVPTVSRTSAGGTDTWVDYWRFTKAVIERSFAEVFEETNIHVEAHGNAFISTCFLYGLAEEEVPKEMLNRDDPEYEFIITVRAKKK